MTRWRRWRVDVALALMLAGGALLILGTAPLERGLGVVLVGLSYGIVAFDLAPPGRR